MSLTLALAVATATTSFAGASSSFALREHVDYVRFRVALGGEWDTNARRAVEGAEASERTRTEEGDALVRALVDAQGRLRFGRRHRLTLGYLLGAKRFFGVTGQDLVAHELTIDSRHRLFNGGALGISARGRSHRVRDDTARDYDLGLMRTGFSFRLSRLSFELSGALSGYDYPEQPFFSYWSPAIRGTMAVVLSRRWDISISAGYAHRDYAGPGLVQTFLVDTEGNRFGPFPTFCTNPDATEQCTQVQRADDEVQVQSGISYRGPFLGNSALLLGIQYLLSIQRSTSDYENVNRHRASLFATVSLPASFTLSVLSALQFNDGTSITDTLTLAEDDQNRNVLQAKLAHRFSDPISIELRYALFADQFSTTDVSYLRQTIYLGLAFETGI